MTTSPQHDQRLRRLGADAPGRVIRVDPKRRQEAIERLVNAGRNVDPEAAGRFLAFSRSNRIGLDAMWALLDIRGRIVATALAVPNPGRTAMVFATRALRPEDVEPLAGLVQCAGSELADFEVDLAQVLLDPLEVLDQQVFEGGGFRDLADLSYLDRPLGRGAPPPEPVWPDGVTVATYSPSLRPAFIDALRQSYVDTLDCPGLNGLRRTEDILTGHQSTGAFEPELWTLLQIDRRPVGALLLNPTPQSRSIELVYLGLGPEVRGRGLGERLLRHGLRRIHRRAERHVTLAVDDRNTPALTLYERNGFRRVMRRHAMIRPLRARATG